MKTTYAFHFMTKEDFCDYMLGGNRYIIRTGYIKGETKEEAIDKAIALFGDVYEILTSSFKTEEDVKKEDEAAKHKAEAEKTKEHEMRQLNEEKRALITEIGSCLEDFHHMEEENPAAYVDDVEIVNPEREIIFRVGENRYSLTLTCHKN